VHPVWIRVLALSPDGQKHSSEGTPNAGGWDGFISLSGANYGVTVAGCAWNGFAWGSMVVGWVNFGGNGGTVTGVGDACMAPLLDPNLISEAIVVPCLSKGKYPNPTLRKGKERITD
jgi:hypothetical protein